MKDYEYQRKMHPERYRRDWFLTVVAGILAAIVILGIVSAWKHLAHDAFLICSVIVPASIIAVCLILAALNGGRHNITDIFGSILEMLFFWWP